MSFSPSLTPTLHLTESLEVVSEASKVNQYDKEEQVMLGYSPGPSLTE